MREALWAIAEVLFFIALFLIEFFTGFVWLVIGLFVGVFLIGLVLWRNGNG